LYAIIADGYMLVMMIHELSVIYVLLEPWWIRWIEV